MTDKITEPTKLAARNGVPFAFRPMMNRRMSVDFSGNGGYAPIAQPGGAQPRPVRVVDADVDIETRRVIDFLERLNDPKTIAAAAEKESADTRPLDAFVTACQEHRRNFADRLVESQLGSVLKRDADSTVLDEDLKRRVSDRLSRDLTRFDTTGGFLVYPDDSAPAQPKGAELHGTLIFSAPATDVPDGHAPASPEIQPFAIEIGATTAPEKDRRSTLMLSFPLQEDNILAAPPAGIRLTHLQALERTNAGDPNNDYRPTAWLKLHDQAAEAGDAQSLDGWSKVALKPDPAVIPLRRVPRPPTLIKERFAPRWRPGQPLTRLRALRQWTALHRLDISDMRGQDKLTSSVTYSNGSGGARQGAEAFAQAQEPLAIRVLRFGKEIRDIDVRDVYVGPEAGMLRRWLTSRLDALVAPLPARAEQAGAARPPRDVVTVQEVGPDSGVQVILERLEQVAPKADWLWEDGGPNKEFQIPDEGMGPVPNNPPRPRPASPIRQLCLRELDAFVEAEATSQHYIDRNRDADNKPLRDGFVYTTPRVGSAEPIVPVLDYKSEVELGNTIETTNGTIETDPLWQQLRRIFQELLGETDRVLTTDIVIEYENDVFLGGGSPSGPDWRERGGPLIVAVTGFTGTTAQELDRLTRQIVECLTAWAGNGGPIRDPSNEPIGRLLFDLRVFNATPLGETELDDTRVLWVRRGVLKFKGQMP